MNYHVSLIEIKLKLKLLHVVFHCAWRQVCISGYQLWKVACTGPYNTGWTSTVTFTGKRKKTTNNLFPIMIINITSSYIFRLKRKIISLSPKSLSERLP